MSKILSFFIVVMILIVKWQ